MKHHTTQTETKQEAEQDKTEQQQRTEHQEGGTKMCVNQTTILNKKYVPNKKNGGNAPILKDVRQKYVAVPCGKCFICKKKKAREWRMRITEDIKEYPNAKIVTLTFNTKSLIQIRNGEDINGKKIRDAIALEGYELDNEICRIAVKLFRERWRKKYGRSIRHWLITELGHGETEHVHMHGIVWEDERYKLENKLLNEVEKIWTYGWVGKGKKNYITGEWINYVNAKTANYFTKYVNKIDKEHENYRQIVLCSAGIGAGYLKSEKATDNIYRGKETNQQYNIDTGGVLPMAEYFRRKIYKDEEREKLTSAYLDKEITYIDGKEVQLKVGEIEIAKMRKELKLKNAQLGYENSRNKETKKKLYEYQKRKKIHEKRMGKIKDETTKWEEEGEKWIDKIKNPTEEQKEKWRQDAEREEENKFWADMNKPNTH